MSVAQCKQPLCCILQVYVYSDSAVDAVEAGGEAAGAMEVSEDEEEEEEAAVMA